jgi:hypothetical protein
MSSESNPPEKTIDIGDLTAVVTASVQRALAERQASPDFIQSQRIIIGIIFEPKSRPQ